MTREEAQPAWEKIVEIGFSDYSLLSPEQRIWFNVESIATGGVIDHYINYGAEHNRETIADLERLGFSDVSELFKNVNKLFKNGHVPDDIDERNEVISNLSEEENNLLEDVEKQFWERCDNLEQALLEFINSTGIGVSS